MIPKVPPFQNPDRTMDISEEARREQDREEALKRFAGDLEGEVSVAWDMLMPVVDKHYQLWGNGSGKGDPWGPWVSFSDEEGIACCHWRYDMNVERFVRFTEYPMPTAHRCPVKP